MMLKRKISLVTGLLITGIILAMGLLITQQWLRTLQTQLELESRDLAITISHMDTVRYNLTRSNGSIPIQRSMEGLRLKTRAQYIHVINSEGIYYSHTYPAYQGTRITDPYYSRLLEEPGISVRRAGETRRPTVEAAAPVYYQGKPVGLVVTGLLNGRIYQEVSSHLIAFGLAFLLAVFAGLYSAGFLSRSIKKSIYDLEPDEIARLLGQRILILENLKEAIVSIDQNSRIIFINRAAGRFLSLNDMDLNRPVGLYPFREGFEECLASGNQQVREVHAPGGEILFSRFKALREEKTGEVMGVTAVMDDLTEVRRRAEELTGIKQINESLRAQNHEFINKLHTISGLIQLEEYEEAIRFITRTSENRQEIIALLTRCIKDSSVAGLILGKYNRAREQKTEFSLDPESYLPSLPGRTDLISLILGNLLENSLEELAGSPEGRIGLSIAEEGNKIIIELEDNGAGISREEQSKVFKKGFSRKGADRGFGLFLIREKIRDAGGTIHLESRPGETLFTIILPKEEL